jgi:ribose 5-phosphate isomerase B
LCMGGRIIGIELAKEITAAFLKARYWGLERFQRRLDKIKELEVKKFG